MNYKFYIMVAKFVAIKKVVDRFEPISSKNILKEKNNLVYKYKFDTVLHFVFKTLFSICFLNFSN